MPQALSDIAHVIQLAIAPVFLLTAIGTVLNVLAGRLTRAVDRRRVLVARLPGLEVEVADLARAEIAFEVRRIRLVYFAISMAVLSALLVCLLISLAFVDAFVSHGPRQAHRRALHPRHGGADRVPDRVHARDLPLGQQPARAGDLNSFIHP